MKNSFAGKYGPWTLEGVSPRARDAAIAAAERRKQTLGEWMTQAICDQIQHDPQPESRLCPNRMISEADSDDYQLDLVERNDIGDVLVRTINDHEVFLPGNPGDATAEPPRFE